MSWFRPMSSELRRKVRKVRWISCEVRQTVLGFRFTRSAGGAAGHERTEMKTTLEATTLSMGEREIYLATAEVPAAVQIIEQPATWDALAPQPHGNRVRSKDHVAGIVEYVRNEPNPILNSLVIYPRDA